MALPVQPPVLAADGLQKAIDDDDLIGRYIELGPGYDTPDEALVAGTVSMAALMAHLQRFDGNEAASAHAYRIPIEAVRAADRYYRRHKAVVDARITLDLASSTDYPAPRDDRDEFIARFIEAAPNVSDPAKVMVGGTATLAALMDYLTEVGGDVDAAARTFGLPIEAVHAARAFHARRGASLGGAWR